MPERSGQMQNVGTVLPMKRKVLMIPVRNCYCLGAECYAFRVNMAFLGLEQ